MGAAELVFTVDAKRVVPDHPAAAGKPQLPRGHHFQLSGILIANRQPKRPVGRQNPLHFRSPAAAPVEVVVGRSLVVVGVVVVADVERRIGKGQLSCSVGEQPQVFQAVASHEPIADREFELGFSRHAGRPSRGGGRDLVVYFASRLWPAARQSDRPARTQPHQAIRRWCGCRFARSRA